MSCDDFAELISAQIDGELDAAEGEQLEAHLRDCQTCQRLQQRMQQLNQGLAQLPEVAPPPLKVTPLPAPRKVRRWLAAAAAVAACIGLYFYSLPPDGTTLYLGDSCQLVTHAPQEKTVAIQVFESHPLHCSKHNADELRFELYLDSHSHACKDLQLEVRYDFDGDQKVDRVEVYRHFATDNKDGWEVYSQAQGLDSVQGEMRDFTGGRVTARLLNAPPDLKVLEGRSRLTLPYRGSA